MRVGLNLLYFIVGQGGVETFGRELMQALRDSAGKDIEYVVYTSRCGMELTATADERVKVRICPFNATNRGVRYLWEQFILPWQALADGVDILHSLAYVGPIFSFVPTVVTIHDANSRVVGTDMSLQRRAVLWNISRLASRTARLVATVSNFSRDELVRWYKLPVSKIRVIYCGPGSSLNAVPASRTGENAFEISGPYIAVIGGEYPHKNIARLVKAYGRIASKINHKLVIAGLIPQDVAKLIKGLNLQSIIVTGYLSRAELREAIAGSDLFVMPSLYEGFGAPVLEAQGLGVPVACSSAGSLPEIMGGSAVLFDPKDIDAMGTAIARCVSDRALNSELRTLGRENFARFTWRNTADAYSSCYRELMNWKSKPRSSR